MAGAEGGNAAADQPAADAMAGAAEADQLAAAAADAVVPAEKRAPMMPAEEVEYLLSRDYSRPLPRHRDDEDDPHKDEWNDGVDFFNDIRRKLAATQAILRAEYAAKGYIDLGHDQVAARARLSHQAYLNAKAAAAPGDDHVYFAENLEEEHNDNE